MRSYMDGNFGTFDDCKVLYYEAEPTLEILETFDQVSAQIAEKTGAVFEQTDDYTEAQKQVERSEAVAVIKLEADGFDYFRSTFNEPYGGDIIRSLFTQLTNTPTDSPNFVQSIQLDVKKTNSDVYYTFIGMVFAIMFMGSFVSNSYGKDFSSQTLDRMYLSRAGKLPILGSKLLCGFLCGILQMAIALPLPLPSSTLTGRITPFSFCLSLPLFWSSVLLLVRWLVSSSKRNPIVPHLL